MEILTGGVILLGLFSSFAGVKFFLNKYRLDISTPNYLMPNQESDEAPPKYTEIVY